MRYGWILFLILILGFIFWGDIQPWFESLSEEIKDSNGSILNSVVKEFKNIDEIEYSISGPTVEELYYSGNKSVTYTYRTYGQPHEVTFTVYDGVNDYLSGLSRYISYYQNEPTTEDFLLKNIDNEIQIEAIQPFVDFIEENAETNNEKARMAISLVQNIPYDYNGFYGDDLNSKYAYEVLYTNTGVCGEKSELLIHLLRELGFGVAYLNFDSQSHAAVGIKCSEEYDYLDSGYCFVESTVPSMITDDQGDYIDTGELTEVEEIIIVSNGLSLTDVKEDYNDAIRLNQIQAMGLFLDMSTYNEWENLIDKYGIIVGE